MTPPGQACGALVAGFVIAVSACSGTAVPAPSASVSPRTSGSPTPVAITPPSTLITPGTITFLSDLTYPPQESEVNGQAVGFDVDVAQAIAARMRLRATIQPADGSTLVQALLAKKGDAIISAMMITADLEKQVAFVGYFETGQSILVRKGNPAGISTLADLCGKKVSVEVTTPEQDTLTAANSSLCQTRPITIRTYPTDTEAVQDLKLGTVDAAMDDTPVASFFVKNTPDQLELAGSPLQPGSEGIAIDPQNTNLLHALQQAMLSIYQDGTYHQLLLKWNLLPDEIPAADIIVSPNPSPSPSPTPS